MPDMGKGRRTALERSAVAHYPDLQIHPVPIALKPVHVVQTWHQRTHQDLMRSWLRQQIEELLDASTVPLQQ